ncbi:hypothetical protein ACWEO1_16875 [Kitasatospora cineracea]
MGQLVDLVFKDVERLGLDVPAMRETTLELGRGGPRQKWHAPRRRFGGCTSRPASARIEQVPLLVALQSLCSFCTGQLEPPVRALWELYTEIITTDRDAGAVEAEAAKGGGTWPQFVRIRLRAPQLRDGAVRELAAAASGLLPAEQARQVLGAWEAAAARWDAAAARFRAVLAPPPLLAAAVAGLLPGPGTGGLSYRSRCLPHRTRPGPSSRW